MTENRAVRLRNLAVARRQERKRRRARAKEQATIALGRVKLGAWFRYAGGDPFQIQQIKWSKSDPPIPREVTIVKGDSREQAVGPAKLLLGTDVEYLGGPDWSPEQETDDAV